MTSVMSRIRITIDTEEAHKRAFLAKASLMGLTPQELFQKMVEAECAEELDRAERAIAKKADEDKSPKKK